MQNISLDELKLVIFDWDDTLVKTRDALVYSINKILPKYGFKDWDDARKFRDNNLSFQNNFPLIFKEKTKEAWGDYVKIYKSEGYKYVKKMEGFDEILGFLSSKNIPMAVMTNKNRNLFEFDLKNVFSNKSPFSGTVCGNEAKQDKPSPEQAWFVSDEHISRENINEKTVWVVGDSYSKDAGVAFNIGAKPIIVGKSFWDDDKNMHDERVSYFLTLKALFEAIVK